MLAVGAGLAGGLARRRFGFLRDFRRRRVVAHGRSPFSTSRKCESRASLTFENTWDDARVNFAVGNSRGARRRLSGPFIRDL